LARISAGRVHPIWDAMTWKWDAPEDAERTRDLPNQKRVRIPFSLCSTTTVWPELISAVNKSQQITTEVNRIQQKSTVYDDLRQPTAIYDNPVTLWRRPNAAKTW